MSPGEELSLDYADILGISVLVQKDRTSGHIIAKITKDKTTESVEKVLMKYFGHYGLPYRIISDGAGCFRGRFQEFCRGLHIESLHTSAYRSP